MDGQWCILENHAIAIEQGKVVEIGKTADLQKKHSTAEVLDASAAS